MKALVTGGGGFLGRYVVEQLLARGDEVTVFTRGEYPELTALGVTVIRGDLSNESAVIAAFNGIECVFHVAAKAGAWGAYQDFYNTNVVGTQNVIAACRKNGIRKLVNCSSPSVIFDNKAHEGIQEDYPYPHTYECPYPETKAAAEQLVTQANDNDLMTVTLRPHLIIGPRDRHLLPQVLAAAKGGSLPQVGRADNFVDLSYVEDVARAHLLAADRLEPGSTVPGSIYFISQDEPVNLWPWLRNLLERTGYPQPKFALSLGIARFAAGMMEWFYRNFVPKGTPKLTRFLASELALSHWYDISAAKKELGYSPQHTMKEVEDLVVEWVNNGMPSGDQQ
jgi:nucleoside-diphosphate-sugar epimerase